MQCSSSSEGKGDLVQLMFANCLQSWRNCVWLFVWLQLRKTRTKTQRRTSPQCPTTAATRRGPNGSPALQLTSWHSRAFWQVGSFISRVIPQGLCRPACRCFGSKLLSVHRDGQADWTALLNRVLALYQGISFPHEQWNAQSCTKVGICSFGSNSSVCTLMYSSVDDWAQSTN